MTVDLFDCRDAFSDELIRIARDDDRVVAVVNDSIGSTKLAGFRAEFPDRLVNVGIAEQNMVGAAAGLANGGLIPFVCGAACFLTARALEQIKTDLAYSQANVKLIGVSSGMAYGELGPTHHSIEDMAWTRAIADLAVVVPADPAETRAAVRAAHHLDGPVFIRTSRTPVPAILPEGHRFEFGTAPMLRDGRAASIIANGTLVAPSLEAADLLSRDGVDVRVLNMSSISPPDTNAIVAAARDTGAIVVVEEHTVRGGLGGLVAETVVQHHPVPVQLMGVPGVFAPTGSYQFLVEHFGLTPGGIVEAVRATIARRSPP